MDRAVLFGLFLLLSISLFSSADDCLWSCQEGDFSRQDCWSCGHLPNITDTINVQNATIFVSQEVSVQSATLDLVNLTLYSENFNVAGTLSLSRSFLTTLNNLNITNTTFTTISSSKLQMTESSLLIDRDTLLSTKDGVIRGKITAQATQSTLTLNGNFSIEANLYGDGTITSYPNATLYISQNAQQWEVDNGDLYGVIFIGPSSVTTTKPFRLQKPILSVESPPRSWNDTIPLVSGPLLAVAPILAGKFSCFGGVFGNSDGLRFQYHIEPVLSTDSVYFAEDFVISWSLPDTTSHVCGGFRADAFHVEIDGVATTNVTVGENITVSNSAFPACKMSTVSVQMNFISKTYPDVQLHTQSSTTARSVRSLLVFRPNTSLVNITYDDVNVTVGWSAPGNITWPCDSTLENTNVFLRTYKGNTKEPGTIRLPTREDTVKYTWAATPCDGYTVIYNVSLVTPGGYKFTSQLSEETPKLIFAPVSAVPSLPSVSQFVEDSHGEIRTLLTWGSTSPQCGPCGDQSDLHREIYYNGTTTSIYGGSSDFIVHAYNMTITVEETDVCVYSEYTFKSQPVRFNITVPPQDKIITRSPNISPDQEMPKNEKIALILFAVLLFLSALSVAAVMFRRWQLKQRLQYTTLN